MIEQTSADAIGQYGYEHWTGKLIAPDVHNIALVPQSIADGWEAYCSCGEWRGFASFYEFPTRDGLIAALKDRHAAHVSQIP